MSGLSAFGDPLDNVKVSAFGDPFDGEDSATEATYKPNVDTDKTSAFKEAAPISASFVSGTTKLGQLVLDTPKFAADVVNEIVVNPFLHLFGEDLGPARRMEFAQDLEAVSQELTTDVRNKPVEDLGVSTPEARAETASWIAQQAAAQAPQLVTGAAASFIPKLRNAYLGFMATTSGAGSNVENQQEGVDDQRRVIGAVTNGAWEAVGEALPFEAFDKIGGLIKRLPDSEKAAFISDITKKTLAATAAMTAQHATEGVGEMVTQAGQNWTQRDIIGDKRVQIGDGVLTAGAIGAIMATPTSVAHGVQAYRDDHRSVPEMLAQPKPQPAEILNASTLDDALQTFDAATAPDAATQPVADNTDAIPADELLSGLDEPQFNQSTAVEQPNAIPQNDAAVQQSDLVSAAPAGDMVRPGAGVGLINAAPAVGTDIVGGELATGEAERAGDATGIDAQLSAGEGSAAVTDIQPDGRIPYDSSLASSKQDGFTVRFGGQKYPIESLRDASDKWVAFRDETDAGASEIGNGVPVFNKDGVQVARISYNGRIWNGVDEISGYPDDAKVVNQPAQSTEIPQKAELPPKNPKLIPVSKRKATTLIERINQLGGVNKRYASDITGESNPTKSGYVGMFRNDGKGLDELATALAAEGFPIDVNDPNDNGGVNQLTELLRNKSNVQTYAAQEEAKAEAERKAHNEQIRTRAKELGLKTAFKSASELERMVAAAEEALAKRQEAMDEWTMQAYSALYADAEASFGEEAASALVAQTEHDTVAVSYGQLLDAVRKAKNEQNTRNAGAGSEGSAVQSIGEDASPAGQADAGAARASDGSRSAENSAQRDEEGFALEAQTNEQLVQQEAALRAEETRKQDEERKAAAEAERNNVRQLSEGAAAGFQLGQSAEDNLTGQQDIFSQPPAEETSSAQAGNVKQDDVVFEEGKGRLGSGKWIARIGDTSGNLMPSKEEAEKSLREILDAQSQFATQSEKVAEAQLAVADKLKSGENPSFNEWKAAFPQLRDADTYLRQPEISPFLIEHFGIKRNAIKAAIGDAAGNVTSDMGAKYPIVYFNKLAGALSKAEESAQSKKLEVLKAQAAGKITGDQGAALKELADAGETAAVDEVLKPSEDLNGFTKTDNADGSFTLRDGNMIVRVEPTEKGKYQAHFRGARSSPHLQGVQGAVAWADAYREEAQRVEAVDTSAKPVEKSAENVQIDDFGEKLGGARKDLAAAIKQEYSDSDIASLPLSKIWPADLAEKIEDKFVAAFAFAARQEIPSKPRVGYKVKAWVAKVKLLRDLTSMMTGSEMTKERAATLLKETKALDGFNSKIAMLESIDREQWKRIGKVNEYPNAYTYDDAGKQVPAPSVLVEIDDKRVRFDGAKSVADVIDRVNEKLGVAAKGKRMEFEVRGQPGAYFINKKGDPLYRKLKTFDTSKEALDFKRDNYDDLVAAWEAVKDSDNVKESDLRTRENRERTAEDWRKGKDVTPEQFVNEFGFRGIEFGNWVNQGKNAKERQGMLNAAYDALMDLSSIINVPPKAISLEGTLGLGFGSRGSGAASAHFEPDTLVINLTKTRGAGTLAHEWFHALDNYFQLKRGKPATWKREDGFITYNPENYYVHKETGFRLPERAFNKMIEGERHPGYGTISTRYRDKSQWEMKEGVRTEVAEAFADLVKSLNDSPMAKRASLIDKGKSGGYWSRIIERGARSFENYVIHKMMLKGYHNDYLANVTPANEFQRDAGRYPYLLEGEIEPVAEAFDNLFQTIKTKEADKGVALFSQSQSKSIQGMTTAQLEQALPDAFSGRERKAMEAYIESGKARIVSAQQAASLVGEDVLFANDESNPDISYSKDGRALAFFNPSDQNTYFIADHIDKTTTDQELRGLALHEIAVHAKHLGRSGAEWKAIQKQFEMMVKAGNKKAKEAMAAVPEGTPEENRIEEGVAYLVQNNPDLPFVKRVLAWLRNAIREIGKKFPAMQKLRWNAWANALTEDDIVFMAKAAFAREQAQEQAGTAGESVMASRGKMDPEVFARMVMEEFVAENDSAFSIPTTKSKTVPGAIADVVEGATYKGEVSQADERAQSGADRVYLFVSKEGDEFRVSETDDGQVWIDVSQFLKGGSGQRVYSAIADYAFNTGKKFIGDPAGLTMDSMIRRTVNMMTSAFKHGTTRHLDAAQQQEWGKPEEGVEPLVWEGSDVDKLDALVHTFLATTQNLAPEIKEFRYDFNTQQFTDREGNVVNGDDIAESIKRGSAIRKNGQSGIRIGEKTARRAVFLQSLVSAARQGNGERAAILESVLRWNSSPESLRRLFSRTAGENVDNGDRGSKPPKGGSQDRLNLQGGEAGNAASWDAPEASKIDDILYTLQDKNIDMKRVVESIKDAGGKLIEKFNPYLAEELFHGRAAKRTHDFVNTELKPLLDDMKMRGLDVDELDQYLHARHAKEANKLAAERNPNDPKMQDGGSGMTNAEADEYMAGLDDSKRKRLEAAAAKVDAIITKTRDLYVSYGLVSKDQADSWAEMFQHYVPLMREDNDGGMGLGQGFSIKGKEVKHRTGSKAKVVDILANIALQREKAITRGEKNRVAVALAGLVKLNPNPDFWTFDKPPVERVLNETTGLVEDRIDPTFKSRPNVVVAKIKDSSGQVQERAVIFNEDNERAMRMAESIKNLDHIQLGGVMGVSAMVTRYFASINTQYNPVFGIVNITRDVQAMALNLSSTPLAKHRADVLKLIPSAVKGIYLDSRAERQGHAANSKWAQLWEDLQDEGGMTGYRDLYRNSEDRANEIKRELDPTRWQNSALGKVFTVNGALKVPLSLAQKKAGWLFDWLSDYNQTLEGATRLAAYKVAVDNGMTKQQAASLAKNITVNFNRKGHIGQQAGAMYAFFNAAMQGTARIAQTMLTYENGKAGLTKAGKAIVYGGMTLGVLQAFALAFAGLDDDEPPEFVRERSLVIPFGAVQRMFGVDKKDLSKRYITIPMPLGFHVFPNLGRVPTEWALDGFRDTGRRMTDLVGIFIEAFNPIGSAGMSLQTLMPTAIDPAMALAENRDWTGKPIYKEDFNSMKPTPGFERNKDTATAWSKGIAEALNYLSGGTDYTPGAISPTADQIDYLIGQVTGGVGREIGKMAQTGESAITGEALPPHKVPLMGRFYGNAENQSSQGNAYYSNLKRIFQVEAEIKGRREDKLPIDEYKADNPEWRLITRARYADRVIHKLKKQKRDMVEKGADREKIRAIEDRITNEMRRLNDAVRELEEKESA